MSKETELRHRLNRLAGLVHELEEAADPNVRAAAKDLVQLLMDLNATAIERMLETVYQSSENGQRIIDQLGADPLISGLLVLYGLHPDDLQTRVERALRQTAASLQSHSAAAELINIHGSDVRILASTGAHTCGSTVKTVHSLIEDAVYEAAPDITSLSIEGLDGKPATGFVSVERLLVRSTSGAAHEDVHQTNPEVPVEQTSGD